MRAVGYFAPGPITAPDSLVDIELPRPSATGRDLLVEVRAVSVNPVDYKVRASAAPPAGGAAKVIGYDAAGVVVDPVIPRCEKCTLAIEAIGGDKVRVNHQLLDTPLVILANQALEVVGIGKELHIARALRSAEYFNVDLTGMVEAGYGPETKSGAM
jgi:hypothetical protein